MYAIVDDNGQQIKVEQGQRLEIDLREASAGDQITFDRVLVISGDNGIQLGQPTVEGASVTAEVLGVAQGPKLIVQKLRRRKNSRRKNGHRQMYTLVRIDAIEGSLESSGDEKTSVEPEETVEVEAAEQVDDQEVSNETAAEVDEVEAAEAAEETAADEGEAEEAAEETAADEGEAEEAAEETAAEEGEAEESAEETAAEEGEAEESAEDEGDESDDSKDA
jgi:large subunit ribosomal protein L21